MKKISVIVPIYNAEKYLDSFFDSIEKNEFIAGDEVLLIDNGSKDKSVEKCKNKEKENPQLYKCLSYTKKAGSYATRNYGVKNANGDILIFTDSDTKPSKKWISVIRNKIDDNMVISGKIELEVMNGCLWELFDKIAHLNSEQNAKKLLVATANMAVLKKEFQKVGFFEERFSGGDYDWSQRAARKNLHIEFFPQAVVMHPTRKTFEEILKKEERIAFGQGNHYKLINASFAKLLFVYILKIFKIDTNIKHSYKLLKMGATPKDLIEFNIKFFRIRIAQLSYAIRGYKMQNGHEIGLK